MMGQGQWGKVPLIWIFWERGDDDCGRLGGETERGEGQHIGTALSQARAGELAGRERGRKKSNGDTGTVEHSRYTSGWGEEETVE